MSRALGFSPFAAGKAAKRCLEMQYVGPCFTCPLQDGCMLGSLPGTGPGGESGQVHGRARPHGKPAKCVWRLVGKEGFGCLRQAKDA
jgi:hypothetical protein